MWADQLELSYFGSKKLCGRRTEIARNPGLRLYMILKKFEL